MIKVDKIQKIYYKNFFLRIHNECINLCLNHYINVFTTLMSKKIDFIDFLVFCKK